MNIPDHIGEPAWHYGKWNIFIFAGIKEYRGSRFFEIREWTDGVDVKPTQKGVAMPPNAVACLYSALGEWLAGQASAEN